MMLIPLILTLFGTEINLDIRTAERQHMLRIKCSVTVLLV